MSIDQLHQQYLEHINQTKYPYYDISGSWLNKVRKVVAPINPFAMEQSSSNERLQAAPFNKGNYFFIPNIPNPVKYKAFMQPHYDANTAKDNIAENKSFALSGPPQDQTFPTLRAQKFPRVCDRYLGFYKRCASINGASKCEKEEHDFLSICPNFALEDYRAGKVFSEKVKYIQRQEYHEAMEISSYNKGRSIAQVDARKRWIDGTSANLRPDSMWIDDRYVDVTQEEIDAAKKRVAARQAAREALNPAAAHHGKAHETHHDQHKGKH